MKKIKMASSLVDITVRTFIDKIVSEYSIEKDELIMLWEGMNKTEDVPKVEKKFDRESLEKMTKPLLVEICKEKGIRHTGTKVEVVDRILESVANVGGVKIVKVVESKKKKVESKPIQQQKTDVKEILRSKVETISIKRNKYGNYEHSVSRIVFDKINQDAIGTQNDNGTINSLTQKDIEECKKYKFKYQLPSNLDKRNVAATKDDDSDIESDIEKQDVKEEEEIVIENDVEEDAEEEDELDLDDDVEEIYDSDN